MNQSELFYRWATGQITGLQPTVVGTVHAVPHRLFYGPGRSSLALLHNGMVLVSGITRAGVVHNGLIHQHRTKLYRQCREHDVEVSRAVGGTPTIRRPGYPSAFFAVRFHIEELIAGQDPDPYQIHEGYGYFLSRNPDYRIFDRYQFVCKMIGCAPVHDTLPALVDWYRCASLLTPSPNK